MPGIIELSESQARQYIDAETAFGELRRVRQEAQRYAGGMFWKNGGGRRYLVRTSLRATQKSLGVESEETRLIHERFQHRKTEIEERRKTIQASVAEQVRLNKALRVGRVPAVVVKILDALDRSGVAEHFTVVGTHAMYAYESAAGIRFTPSAMATRDIDLLFDTRRRISFVSRLKEADTSFIGLLRKVDKSFERVEKQKETARNASGFEVDVIRRVAAQEDPHPLRLSGSEDDVWAVQAPTAGRILHAPRMSQTVVAVTGEMASMTTIAPLHFAAVKRVLATLDSRDPRKKSKDLLQADLVEQVVHRYLPQFRAPQADGPASGPRSEAPAT